MALHRGFVDDEPVGDLAVRQALGDKPEHFGFPGSEAVGELRHAFVVGGGRAGGESVEDVLLYGWVDGGLTLGELLEGALDLFCAGVLVK